MSKIIEKLFSKPKRSLVDALGCQVSQAQFRNILSNNVDFRMLPADVSRETGISEALIMEKVARTLSLPFLYRVPPIDLSKLPSECSLSTLRSIGATIIPAPGGILGLVCVDPSRCAEVIRKFVIRDLYIASWMKISNALQESEDLLNRSEEINRLRLECSLIEQAKKALRYVIFEAMERGSAKVLFYPTQNPPKYEFSVQGKTAQGEFSRAFNGSLTKILGNSVWPTLSEFPFSACKLELLQEENAVRIILPTDRKNSREEAGLQTDITTTSTREVVMVEDDPVFGQVLERFLSRESFTLKRFSEAESALHYVLNAEVPPRVIVSDLYLPRMSGRDLIKGIRKEKVGSEILMIILTSDESVETELAAIEAGADLLITKGRDPRILCAHIRRVIGPRLLKDAA